MPLHIYTDRVISGARKLISVEGNTAFHKIVWLAEYLESMYVFLVEIGRKRGTLSL